MKFIFFTFQVALILSLTGGCRCNELLEMSIDNVKDKGSYMLASVSDAKAYVSKSFTIIEESFSVNSLDICRKYFSQQAAFVL